MCCPVDASRNVPQLLSNKNKVVKKDIWTGILSHETQTLSTHHLLWFRCFATCNGRLHVVRMELLRKMPHQNIKLDRVLSASGQHCLVWAPSKMTILDGWGPNFAAYQSSLAGTFQGSPELLKIWIEFFVTRTNSWGFQPHQKLHFWIRPQFCSVTMFFASHVLRMKLNITLLLCNHLDSFPVAEFPCMFPSSAHLFPHLYDL